MSAEDRFLERPWLSAVAIPLLVFGVAACAPAMNPSCDRDEECPATFHCSADHMCVANGQVPDSSHGDAVTGDGAAADRGGVDGSDAGISDRQRHDAASVPDAHVPDTSAPDTNLPDTSAPDTNLPDTSAPDTNGPDLILLPGATCGSSAQCSTNSCYKSVCCEGSATYCNQYECRRCEPGTGNCVADEGTPCQPAATRNCTELIFGVVDAECRAYGDHVVTPYCHANGSCVVPDLAEFCAAYATAGGAIDRCGDSHCVSDNHSCWTGTLVVDYATGEFCVSNGTTSACATSCVYSAFGWTSSVWSCDGYSYCQYDGDRSRGCGLYRCQDSACLTSCSTDGDCLFSTCQATGQCE